VKCLVHIAEYNHYSECINSEKKNPKLFWNSLREIIGIHKSYVTHCLIDDYNNLINDNDLNANIFNNHFCNVSKTVCIDQTVEFQANESLQIMNVSTLVNVAKFTNPLVTVQFVEQQLNSLNVTKATCIDSISAKYLKLSTSIIAPILTHSV